MSGVATQSNGAVEVTLAADGRKAGTNKKVAPCPDTHLLFAHYILY